MKSFITILRRAGLVVVGIVLFVVLYLVTGYILSRIEVPKEAATSADVTIYILTNGVHTDIVVPVRNPVMDWSKEVRIENTEAKDTSMSLLAFGWGDKGFYLETPTWADLTFSTAFKATFGLGSTAIHATYYKEMHEGSDCKELLISNEQYARLVEFIASSFQLDSSSHYIYIPTSANYGAHDAFYDANGRYNLFNSCNTWTNDALKTCGQKACLWTAFDTGIFYHYR